MAEKLSGWATKDLCLSDKGLICHFPAAVIPALHPIVLCCLLCCPQFVWPQTSWKAVHWPAGISAQHLRRSDKLLCELHAVQACQNQLVNRIERMTNTLLKGLQGMCLVSTFYSTRTTFSVVWQQSKTSILYVLQAILCVICHKYLGLIKWSMLPMIKLQVTTPYSAGIKKGNKSLPFTGCHLSAQAWAVSGDKAHAWWCVKLWEPVPIADSWDLFIGDLTTSCPAVLSSVWLFNFRYISCFSDFY